MSSYVIVPSHTILARFPFKEGFIQMILSELKIPITCLVNTAYCTIRPMTRITGSTPWTRRRVLWRLIYREQESESR